MALKLSTTSVFAAVAMAISALANCGSSTPESMLSVELPENEVSLHEPVYLEIALKNESRERVEADLGVAKIGAFSFAILPEEGGDVARGASPVGPTSFHTGNKVELEPGEHYQSRHLLNEWFTIDSPGSYRVKVLFTGKVTNEDSDEVPVAKEFSLPLTVHPRDPERLQEIARPLLETACQSRDLAASLDAARTLSHIDDVAITGFLVEMLECSFTVQVEAVSGLRRLGTTESIDALIEAAQGSDQALAELAAGVLRSHASRLGPRLDPDQRRRIEEVLQE